MILDPALEEKVKELARVMDEMHEVMGEEQPRAIADYGVHSDKAKEMGEEARLLHLKCLLLTLLEMVPLGKDGNVALRLEVNALEQIYQLNQCPNRLYPVAVLDIIETLKGRGKASNKVERIKLHKLIIHLLGLIALSEAGVADDDAEHDDDDEDMAVDSPAVQFKEDNLRELLLWANLSERLPARSEWVMTLYGRWVETAVAMAPYLDRLALVEEQDRERRWPRRISFQPLLRQKGKCEQF